MRISRILQVILLCFILVHLQDVSILEDPLDYVEGYLWFIYEMIIAFCEKLMLYSIQCKDIFSMLF
jgi:hypothetical protein